MDQNSHPSLTFLSDYNTNIVIPFKGYSISLGFEHQLYEKTRENKIFIFTAIIFKDGQPVTKEFFRDDADVANLMVDEYFIYGQDFPGELIFKIMQIIDDKTRTL